MSSLGNWTNGNDASVCADQSPYPTWNEWDASQRDLYVLDHSGNLVLQQNITGGLPNNLESLIIDLIEQIPDDCNPDLGCGQAITCCDGLLFPTTCCSLNCDESIGECGECEDGEIDNSNPCNPMECWGGVWYEIIIECAEQKGIPCEGGVYIHPAEGECCSICVLSGDLNGDGTINVIDIVMAVDLILSNNYDLVGDVNEDGQLNVLDIVMLVDWVLNGMPEADSDGDGVIDEDDSDPFNPYECSDLDGDTCDDCSTGMLGLLSLI